MLRTHSLPKGGSASGDYYNSAEAVSVRPRSLTSAGSQPEQLDRTGSTARLSPSSEGGRDRALRNSESLDEALSCLQRDITDFSICTLGDFSDTRPLLPPPRPSRQAAAAGSAAPGAVRPLNDDESLKLHRRIDAEHRRVAKSLAKELSSMHKFRQNAEECGEGEGDKTEPAAPARPEDWTDEAQEAYKLLVECGDGLKEPGQPRQHTRSPPSQVSAFSSKHFPLNSG